MSARQIGQDIKRLQTELEAQNEEGNNNIAKLRDEIIQLKRTIDDCSNELSRYDLENYTKDVMSLLKLVQDKEKRLRSSNDGIKKKTFRFKRKSKDVNMKGKAAMTAINSLTTRTTHEKIAISSNVTILQNLESCEVYTTPVNDGDNVDLTKVSGSITLSQVNNSHVDLCNIPFSSGNIFLTDCTHTTIRIVVPPKDKVQLRLHNLTDCKICISLKQPFTVAGEKQTVIIENIKHCIFDLKYKSSIDIQNFSHINGDSDDKEDYLFADIDLNNDNL
ncbi:tubulin-specific chaperone C [Monosporozyma unispora]|nr:hypothetical protein C6P44_003735 [Kazachstania unispora]